MLDFRFAWFLSMPRLCISCFFLQWLTGESSRDDRQNLFGDCACFLVLTPLAIISTWLCITGAMYYHHEGSYFTNWESWGLITLTFLLILIYVTWCGVSQYVLLQLKCIIVYTYMHKQRPTKMVFDCMCVCVGGEALQ